MQLASVGMITPGMLAPTVASAVASAGTALLVLAEGTLAVAAANPLTVGAVALGVGGYCLYNAFLKNDKAQAYNQLQTKLDTGDYLPIESISDYDNNEDDDTIGTLEKKKHGNIDPKLKGKFKDNSAASASGMPEPNDEGEEESKDKYAHFKKKDGSGRYECEKAESPQWKNTQPFKDKFRTNNLPGKEREYYRWDTKHKVIEIYDSMARNIGSKDPVTGKVYREGTYLRNNNLWKILK